MGAPSLPQNVVKLRTDVDAADVAIAALSAPASVRNVSGATAAVTATDAGGYVVVTHTTDTTITLTDTTLQIGQSVTIVQGGTGALAIDPQGSVAINGSTSNLALGAALRSARITKLATNVYLAELNFAPA